MAGIKQPSDKSHFLLPDLGEGLAEAELISWKVKPGDPVKESQTLAEMQTDKALVEVPSPWAGTVSEICGKPGDIIKVGAVLVRYGVKAAGGAAPAASAPATSNGSGGACLSSQVAAGAPGATEDQGCLVTFVHDGDTGVSSFVVLDASDMGNEPLAVVPLPQRVPHGFHGSWFADE